MNGSHVTGEALFCRRVFDKEVYFRTSASATTRRADEVEKAAHEALANCYTIL